MYYMVTVTNYKKKQAQDGKEFIVLELTGGLEMVQSQQTSRFYATIRKCTVSTTFDENIAKSLIGSQIQGKIVRIESDPYEYTIESTGEVVMLMHRWSYVPEGANVTMVHAG
jgi:hypothetical protein